MLDCHKLQYVVSLMRDNEAPVSPSILRMAPLTLLSRIWVPQFQLKHDTWNMDCPQTQSGGTLRQHCEFYLAWLSHWNQDPADAGRADSCSDIPLHCGPSSCNGDTLQF